MSSPAPCLPPPSPAGFSRCVQPALRMKGCWWASLRFWTPTSHESTQNLRLTRRTRTCAGYWSCFSTRYRSFTLGKIWKKKNLSAIVSIFFFYIFIWILLYFIGMRQFTCCRSNTEQYFVWVAEQVTVCGHLIHTHLTYLLTLLVLLKCVCISISWWSGQALCSLMQKAIYVQSKHE